MNITGINEVTDRAREIEQGEPVQKTTPNLQLVPTPSVLVDRNLVSTQSWSIGEQVSMRSYLDSIELTSTEQAGKVYWSFDVDSNFIRRQFSDELLKQYFHMFSTNVCFDIYLQSHFQQVGLLGISSFHMPKTTAEVLGIEPVPSIATSQKLPCLYKKLGSNWMVSIEVPWTNPERFIETRGSINYLLTTLRIIGITPFRTVGNPKATIRIYAYLKGLEYSGWQPR